MIHYLPMKKYLVEINTYMYMYLLLPLFNLFRKKELDMAHEVSHTKLLQVELERNQLKRMVEQYEKERNVVQDFMEKEMISHLKDKYSPFQVVLTISNIVSIRSTSFFLVY